MNFEKAFFHLGCGLDDTSNLDNFYKNKYKT